MNLKDKMKKFNQRWGIEYNESPEEAFQKFKTRILNVFDDIDRYVDEESVTEFCQFYGIEEVWHSDVNGIRRWSTNIIDRLRSESDPIKFFELLEVIFALNIRGLSQYRGMNPINRGSLLKDTQKALSYSNVEVEMTVLPDREVIFYPKGEEMLDEELVNYPLSFLSDGSGAHFIKALKSYQDKNHVDSAEKLRRSLEEFLREKLNNKKGLQANITEIQGKLKSEGSSAQIRNIINYVLSTLDTYFNEESKHNDGDISEYENEFLIYQIGAIMRFINTQNL